ncbi:hypothetical protein QQF64_017029, partial [Cirrhinus molitorella]
MAPLCMVHRLTLSWFLLVVVFVLINADDDSSLLAYDRLTLLNIRATMNSLPDCTNSGHSRTPPPSLASVPAHLWRPVCLLRGSKKRKRRGKRGGILVKLKTYLASCVDDRGIALSGVSAEYGIFDLRRSREYSYRWLRTAIPDDGCLLPCHRPVRTQTRGCVQGNLRPLSRAPNQSRRAVSAALL